MCVWWGLLVVALPAFLLPPLITYYCGSRTSKQDVVVVLLWCAPELFCCFFARIPPSFLYLILLVVEEEQARCGVWWCVVCSSITIYFFLCCVSSFQFGYSTIINTINQLFAWAQYTACLLLSLAACRCLPLLLLLICGTNFNWDRMECKSYNWSVVKMSEKRVGSQPCFPKKIAPPFHSLEKRKTGVV